MNVKRLALLCRGTHLQLSGQRLKWAKDLQWDLVDGVLLFSGSNSLRDWMANFDCRLVDNPVGGGRVHRGWLRLAEQVQPDKLFHTVVGYSLGGAVAQLVAERYSRPLNVVTFGAPPPGDKVWADQYPHPVTRCLVAPDLVAHQWGPFRHPLNAKLFGKWGSPWRLIKNHTETLEVWSE